MPEAEDDTTTVTSMSQDGPPKQGAHVRPIIRTGTSLRSRWYRALAVLFLVVVLGGMASLTATHVLVGTFRQTAQRVEREATALARLRADILPHAILMTGTDFGQVPALGASIRTTFAGAVTDSRSPVARLALRQASDRWEAMVVEVGPLENPAPAEVRGAAVATGGPAVVAMVERAGEAARADARATLAEDTRTEKLGMVALAALLVLISGLMLRFARRLSVEVLRPVRLLRDAANELASGELDHRVELHRADELGDLAVSFNEMAEAIAGNQRTLTRQANHDPLTGLANRAMFQTRLNDALNRPERRNGTQAVLLVDLDDFKDVNDTMGHAAGDALLGAVAERLEAIVRPGDLVARLGGDEFALLLDAVPDVAAALAVAERAVTALAAPVAIDGTLAHVGASVGLAMRHHDSDPESLMRQADVAMYTAKGRGKNRVEQYDAALDDAVAEHNELRAEVVGAAGRGELVLDYQPIIDLSTGTLQGVEALVRWMHPTRGLLPPAAFIELAEETGAIVGMGAWVLHAAAVQLQSWRRCYGLSAMWLSVNVSVRQLDDPGFAALVGDVLRLVLEITESVLADPAGGAAAALETLRGLNVRVALDDFGSGFSSIGYLRQLPVDILKIDRSFVSGEHANRPGDLLLEAIVGLAQRLGLDVIPEGIEEPDQLARLQALGCRIGQGFLLSRPMPAAAIDQLLATPAPLLPLPVRPLGPSPQLV
jgi:diguanylate cyclase (GGDEF)-like protein